MIEVLATTVLVGMGVAGMMVAVASGTRVNAGAMKISEATYLIEEIREWTLKLPFSDADAEDSGNPPGEDGSSAQIYVDDLDDLLGSTGTVSYCPPRDGAGVAISNMDAWTQTITLTWRDVNDLTRTVEVGTSDVIHVEVKVSAHNDPVLTAGWFVTRR